MKRIIKKNIYSWLFKKALKVIAKNVIIYGDRLTSDYLVKKGWILEYDEVREKSYYKQPYIKDRDAIYIEFESNYYAVYHSSSKTFISTGNTIQWFESYYLIIHPDNGLYELSGI